MRHTSICVLLHASLMSMLVSFASAAWAEEGSEAGTLYTFAELWQAAAASLPQLAAAAAGRGIAQGESIQAALRPNPALEIASENLGSGQREETVSVSQAIELGGKRAARMSLAARASAVAEYEVAVKRAAVYADLKQAFVATLAAQSRYALAVSSQELAQRSALSIDRQIEAGRLAKLAGTRARVDVANANLGVARAKSELARARMKLAVASGTPLRNIVADGALESLPEFAPLAELEARLESAPLMLVARHETARRQAEVDVESSRRTGDLTINAGVRHLSSSDEAVGVLSIAIPLPLTNRNQGSVLRAQSAAEQAASDERATYLTLQSELHDTYLKYATAAATVATVRDDIVPAAAAALADTERGFSLGKFGLVDVFETRRILVQARLQLVDACTEVHLAEVALTRIFGPTDPGPSGP